MKASSRKYWQDGFACLVSAFAMVWLLHRALLQSITLDEALTFLFWVQPPAPAYLTAHSNNHVLNSILMRASIGSLGLSHFSFRAPALFGGLLYIVSSMLLSKFLARGIVSRIIILTCLIANPFIMDYLVAARGYGLALGFLGLSLVLVSSIAADLAAGTQRSSYWQAIALSCLAALSFCANFSSAYVNAFLLLAGCLGILLANKKWQRQDLAKLAAAAVLPGAILTMLICGSTLSNFPRHQLFWGAKSLVTTFGQIYESSFAALNRRFVPAELIDPLLWLQSNVLWGFVIVGFAGSMVLIKNWAYQRDEASQARLLLAAACSAVLSLSVLVHWIQFRLFQIPLPYERTSIFLVPLISVGTIAFLAHFSRTRAGHLVRWAGTAVLALVGIYFLSAIRDDYFNEWTDSAEVRTAFPLIEEQCRLMNTHEVVSHLNYTPSLNVYRILNQSNQFDEVANHDSPPAGKQVYVLPRNEFKDFIRSEGLKEVFVGVNSDFSVLVRSPKGQDRIQAAEGEGVR